MASPQPSPSKPGDDSAEFRESQLLSMFRDDKPKDAEKGEPDDDLSSFLGVTKPNAIAR